jgi:hypothetical protein
MEHYNYYVVVKDPEHKDAVHTELQDSNGTHPIPDRAVTCTDAMSWSYHNGLFLLSNEEADQLKTDPRIEDVHRIPSEIGIKLKSVGTRVGNYLRSPANVTLSEKNWGLIRSINQSNVYVDNTSTSSNYTYTLDGTGVDLIVVDSGVEPYHPEFAVNPDGSGGTRVVDHDWTQYGIITSPPAGGFLGDNEGHGSNCASIAAGNTCGWAPRAKIYSLRVLGPGNDITDGRYLDVIDEIQIWGTIRAFHNAKPIDPKTGYKRPTVVTESVLYYSTYYSIASVTYRGRRYATGTVIPNFGMIDAYGTGTEHGYRYTALEAEIQSAISAGVIVCAAAGNNGHKIDLPTGLDYNNYWTDTYGYNYYYHRGGSPAATPGVICVGMIDYSTYQGQEHKSWYSCCGPRIDMWAPGGAIMGAFTNGNSFGPSVYDPRSTVSTSSGASYYLNKLSGTSMATPQVAGVAVLFAQLRPYINAAQALNLIQSYASSWSPDESYYWRNGWFNGTGYYTSATSYANLGYINGAPAKMLFMPFNNPIPLKIS